MKKMMFVLCLSGMVFALVGCGRSDSDIEKDVKPVVEKICSQNGIKATCKKITNIEKDAKNTYSAKALIHSPADLASLKDEEEVYVNVKIEYIDDNVLVEIKQ